MAQQTANSLGVGRKVFEEVLIVSAKSDEMTGPIPMLFDVVNDTQLFTLYKTISGYPMAQAVNDGQYGQGSNLIPQYDLTITPIIVAMRADISLQMRKTDQYSISTRVGTLQKDSINHKKGYYTAQFFGNGLLGTQNSADGVSLFNAAHPVKGLGASYSNLDTTQTMSYSSFESLKIVLAVQKDPMGKRLNTIGNVDLWTSTELSIRAKRILQTPNIAGSADRDVNVMSPMITLGILPYLGDFTQTGFFMRSKQAADSSLYWQTQFDVMPNMTVGYNLEQIFTAQCSFGAGAINGYGIAGQVGQ